MDARPNFQTRLRSIVGRIEDIEAERRRLAEDLADVYTEAKAAGFDTKTVKRVVAMRKLSPSERAEQQALTELYLASLGMLDGTPLGDAARKRLMEQAPPDDGDNSDGTPPPPLPEAAPAPGADEIEAAREKGRAAARAGERVIDNPYVAGDPRRAAWDEGWCEETASDGMGIPDAWRRKAPKEEGEEEKSKPAPKPAAKAEKPPARKPKTKPGRKPKGGTGRKPKAKSAGHDTTKEPADA